MDVREVQSMARSFLDSYAFPYVFGKAFRPVIQQWVYRLVMDKDLPDAERRAIVIALQELYEGFRIAYVNCDLDVPEWLNKEFYRELISE